MSDVKHHLSNTHDNIYLSDAAKHHVLSYLSTQPSSKGIRFSVKKTGCSGLSYVVDFVIAPQDNDVIQPLSETYHIYIDKISYPYLKGLHVDYVKQGLNHKFVFSNPNQTGQCGCGESFTVEQMNKD